MTEHFTEEKPYCVSYKKEHGMADLWCSKDECLKLEKDMINFVCKSYYPIINNIKKKQPRTIFLYTTDCPYINNYIENYTQLSNIYGSNAMNENDIEVCQYLNNKQTKTFRKRTRSIDYECYVEETKDYVCKERINC
jgi:hypothetical protein